MLRERGHFLEKITGSPYDTVSIWHIHVPPNFPKSIARCEALKNGGARRNILFQANPSQSTTIKPDRFTTIDTVTYPNEVNNRSLLEIGTCTRRYWLAGELLFWSEETLGEVYNDLKIIQETEGYIGDEDYKIRWHIDVPPDFPKSIAKCEYREDGVGLRVNVLYHHPTWSYRSNLRIPKVKD